MVTTATNRNSRDGSVAQACAFISTRARLRRGVQYYQIGIYYYFFFCFLLIHPIIVRVPLQWTPTVLVHVNDEKNMSKKRRIRI